MMPPEKPTLSPITIAPRFVTVLVPATKTPMPLLPSVNDAGCALTMVLPTPANMPVLPATRHRAAVGDGAVVADHEADARWPEGDRTDVDDVVGVGARDAEHVVAGGHGDRRFVTVLPSLTSIALVPLSNTVAPG